MGHTMSRCQNPVFLNKRSSTKVTEIMPISVAEWNLPWPRIGCCVFTSYHAGRRSDTLSTFSCLIKENQNYEKYCRFLEFQISSSFIFLLIGSEEFRLFIPFYWLIFSFEILFKWTQWAVKLSKLHRTPVFHCFSFNVSQLSSLGFSSKRFS